jgi:hypothetical protein
MGCGSAFEGGAGGDGGAGATTTTINASTLLVVNDGASVIYVRVFWEGETVAAATTASTEIKSGEAAGRRNLRARLVVERLTGLPQEDNYLNAAMQWGIEKEPDALAAYESLTGNLATTTGFLAHNDHMAGCSLDAHLGDFDILVSLKCPMSATHLDYLRGGDFPAKYRAQMLHELWITGAREYHFLSFDPRFPDHLRTFFVVVPRDAAAIAEYERKALAFLAEVDREIDALNTMTNMRGQLEASVR